MRDTHMSRGGSFAYPAQSRSGKKQVDAQGIEIAGANAKVEGELEALPGNLGWRDHGLHAWAGSCWYPDSWRHRNYERRRTR
jgi:hypothetical protein